MLSGLKQEVFILSQCQCVGNRGAEADMRWQPSEAVTGTGTLDSTNTYQVAERFLLF